MKNLNTLFARRTADERGNIILFCFVMVTVVTVVAGVAMLTSQSSRVTERRDQMVKALNYAQSAVFIACSDISQAVTSTNGSFPGSLTNLANRYTASSNSVFTRTIAAPFSNQTATVTITLPNGSASSTATIQASATVGNVTQTATASGRMAWAYPAAIISVNAGTTDLSNDKASGQAGNFSLNGNGGGAGPIVVYNASGLAVMANGEVDLDHNYVSNQTYSATNWGTANQIPDYTAQGNANTLFDYNRLIAVADLTPGGYAPSGNNHFTNFATFMTACLAHTNKATAMQGVIVVDASQSDPNLNNLTDSAVSIDKKTGLNTGGIPSGMNIQGTLLFNFVGSGWGTVTEKVVVTAPFNINAADLSHLVATNPATYTTGYPPTYTDSTKNPVNIDITSRGFQNFQTGDDLPALIYTTGCLDMHGNANVCGVLYTPCYVELENKNASSTQYFNGCVICGAGMYYENLQSTSSSVIAFDHNTVDSLTSWNNAGKGFFISYWTQ